MNSSLSVASDSIQRTVLSGLSEGGSPLDFVLSNLKPPTQQAPQQAPQPVVQQPAPQQEAPQPVLPPQETDTPLPVVAKPTEVEAVPETPQSIEPESDDSFTSDLLDSVKKKPTKEESFAAVRKKLQEEKQAKEELESKVNELMTRVQQYETGEAIPDSLRTLQERINTLEHYEKLHALKLSPEYQEKYIQPVVELKQKGAALAADYGIPPEVFESALSYTNRKDLNKFLSEHFDSVGAIEAREIIQGIQNIQNQQRQAETTPGQAYEDLLQAAQQQRVEQRQQLYQQVTAKAKTGWTKALTDLVTTEEYPELRVTGDNPEHDAYSKPIVENAAREYGKFVKWLSEQGIDLPEPVAAIMAKRFLLSEAAPVMSKSRANHYNAAKQVIQATRQSAPYDRPPLGTNVGGQNGTGRPRGNQQSLTPMQAADVLLNQVLNK